jgi:uncharacterized protein (DUF924 family)
MAAIATPEDVLSFWFEDVITRPDTLSVQVKRWYSGGKEMDAAITGRFGATVEVLSNGLADAWARQGPRGRLAAIIALDQFSRSIHRKSPKAFANDPLALRLAKEAVARSEDQQLDPIERWFIYMPFEHSEAMADQREAVRLFEKLMSAATDQTRASFQSALDYARRHAEVIEKFGRFPHRNDVLGRTSTPEEAAWVKEHGGF